MFEIITASTAVQDRYILLVTAAIGLVGCDNTPSMDYSSVGLVNATGMIKLDGEPLSNAVVTFDSPDGTFSYGLTDSAGEYELQFDSEMQGVTPTTSPDDERVQLRVEFS